MTVEERTKAALDAGPTDAIKASWFKREIGDTPEDWHKYSNQLDNLYRNGTIKLIGHNDSGMCQYSL